MSNKNWNDRADRDLFFTILSVKNTGVISGGEWTTIGNHMRCMGYGFTNEGCRQHFQGLRRAQNKAEANGTLVLSARNSDPTLNPITRRPGPGRGRPKKQAANVGGEVTPDGQTHENTSLLATPGTAQSAPTPEQVQRPAQEQVVLEGLAQAQTPVTSIQAAMTPAVVSETVEAPYVKVEDVHGPGDEDEDADGEGVDEPPIKRQRLESQELEREEAPLDDEAVLALAAHNGASGPDYQADFSYGEA